MVLKIFLERVFISTGRPVRYFYIDHTARIQSLIHLRQYIPLIVNSAGLTKSMSCKNSHIKLFLRLISQDVIKLKKISLFCLIVRKYPVYIKSEFCLA